MSSLLFSADLNSFLITSHLMFSYLFSLLFNLSQLFSAHLFSYVHLSFSFLFFVFFFLSYSPQLVSAPALLISPQLFSAPALLISSPVRKPQLISGPLARQFQYAICKQQAARDHNGHRTTCATTTQSNNPTRFASTVTKKQRITLARKKLLLS